MCSTADLGLVIWNAQWTIETQGIVARVRDPDYGRTSHATAPFFLLICNIILLSTYHDHCFKVSCDPAARYFLHALSMNDDQITAVQLAGHSEL